MWDHIKNRGDHVLITGFWIGWALCPGNARAVATEGDVIVTQNDVRAGGHFDDLVAYGGDGQWTTTIPAE